MLSGSSDRKGYEVHDYGKAYAAFDAQIAQRAILGGSDALNAAVLCCDRHCGRDRVALTAIGRDGASQQSTFEELRDRSGRFAGVLRELGVEPGDVVAGLLPRTTELIVTILATWRLGAAYQPLFTAFGPKAIEHRIVNAKVVVTDSQNRAKLDEVSASPRIVTVGSKVPSGDIDFRAELARPREIVRPVMRGPGDPFLIMFTSGTTGAAKPLQVPLRAIAAFAFYITDAVGLTPDDRFWNIADPGWAYGLYYAVTGPLALGHATLLYEGGFTVESLTRVIAEQDVTVLAGAPTAYRMVMAAGPEAVAGIKGRLRAVSSAGEPLNPEVIRWFADHLGTTIHDHYGQTELGMVLCNQHGLRHPVHIGAAGYSLRGYRCTVIDDDDTECPPGQTGQLAVDRAASPFLWFEGYVGMPTPSLGERYYRTGDSAEFNADGSISFVGRCDDVITTAGYRVGPFDVESALLEHPAVVEAAVVGKPDPERTELVKAFVVLGAGQAATPALAEELSRHVKSRLSAHAYPREVEFVSELPKTPSGKIQRFILRNQEIANARETGA